MGILAATVANAATSGRGGFTPNDFMPIFGPKRRQSPEDMQAILMSASHQGAAAKQAAPPPKETAKRAK